MKRCLSTLVIILLFSIQLAQAQGETVITLCDYQHVSKALESGGSIVMDCDRVLEVWQDRPLTITVNTSLKPAEGRIVTFKALKGRAFVVEAGITFTLENVTITGRSASGGGIDNNGGILNITNAAFEDNDDSAIHNREGSTLNITNSTFTGNQTYIGGGGIYNEASGEVSVTGSTFANNKSWGDSNGAAIRNMGSLQIVGSIFTGNTAQGRFGWGAAIWNTGDGILRVVNSTFANNTADHSGAAIRNDANGQATISFSTFVDNRSGVWGGALYAEGGTVTVSNSLFSQNTADSEQNDCQALDGISEIITNNNLSAFGCEGDLAEGVATLGDNGGLTQTVALASGSNAIDAAGECPAEAIDQRGTARPQGEACDIGAYEFVPLTEAVNSVGICQITTTRNVRLRTEPNTASTILAVVQHNNTYQALEKVSGWYHITYGEVDGWLSAEFVTTVGDCGG